MHFNVNYYIIHYMSRCHTYMWKYREEYVNREIAIKLSESNQHNEALKEENWVMQGEHLARYQRDLSLRRLFFFKRRHKTRGKSAPSKIRRRLFVRKTRDSHARTFILLRAFVCACRCYLHAIMRWREFATVWTFLYPCAFGESKINHWTSGK